MLPIPDPSRLVPRKLSPDSRPGPRSLSEGLLALAGMPLLLAFAIGSGAYGAAISPWLAIPAGLLGFGLALGILESTILCGLVEAAFYSGIAFVFSGGWEKSDRGPNLIVAAAIATIFLVATYAAWRKSVE